MPSDHVAAVGGPPALADVRRSSPVGRDFSAVLAASRHDPATSATVTLGEMLQHAAGPRVEASAAAATAVTPGAPVDVSAAAGRGMRWPVRGRTTSEFGPRVHPVTGAHRDHDGLDISAATGTPVTAAAAGTVTFAGSRGGYGNVVIIDHGRGLETRYAHQDTVGVAVGQTVRAGQRVGTVGSTGLSTGPHLHFEVRRDGTAIDPRALLGR